MPRWALIVPLLALALLGAALYLPLSTALAWVCAGVLIVAVQAAVYHAEVVAHRTGRRCDRVLVRRQAPLVVDDHLDRERAAYGLVGGGGDRFVVGIGVQRVGVVVDPHSACSVVRMSLNAISWACSDRPEVCTWYFSFWDRSLAP